MSQVIDEVKARPERPQKKPARILIYGGQMDSPDFFQLVEESGANVVMDDLGVGTRFYWHDVDFTEYPLDGLARRYTEKMVCPRIHRIEEPNVRFRYIVDFAREFKANGAVLISHRFCDTHNIEILDVRDCLRREGIPALYLEDDYSMTSIGPLRTRVEAFMETIS